MRVRSLGLLVALLLSASPLAAAEPIKQAEMSVATEVRLVRAPAGFSERHSINRDKGTGLNEAEMKKLLEDAQAHRETSILQFPRITSIDGQTATVRNCERKEYVTGIEVKIVEGRVRTVPTTTGVELGHSLAISGAVSADRRFIRLEANHTYTREIGEPGGYRLSTFFTLVPEGGGGELSHQTFRLPLVKSENIEKTVVVPDGGTIVLGGWNEDAAMPVATRPIASKIPYLRPMKNSRVTEFEVIVLATARIVQSECLEVAPMPRECASATSAVYRLKNVAAADAVQAVSGYLSSNKMPCAIVADPVSNTVFVKAEKGIQNQVRTLLGAMDAPPRQVHLQAVVVQVPCGFLSDIGMSDDADRANVLTLTPRELNLFNTQLRTAKHRDILSRPQITVVDNQTGRVRVGATEHIRAGYEIVAGPNGQTLQFKETPVETGLKLQVTPRIDPKGESVLLRVESSWTKVGGKVIATPLTLPAVITGLPYPLTTDVPSHGSVTTEALTTTAKVDFGQTIIIRGLSCDHPAGGGGAGFAGLAFRALYGSGELLIVLTPHAVKNEAGR